MRTFVKHLLYKFLALFYINHIQRSFLPKSFLSLGNYQKQLSYRRVCSAYLVLTPRLHRARPMTKSTMCRQRAMTALPPAFSGISGAMSAFLGHATNSGKASAPRRPTQTYKRQLIAGPAALPQQPRESVKPKRRPSKKIDTDAPFQPTYQRPQHGDRYVLPVPRALPHEVLKPARGRGSRKRMRTAEHFRKYMYLRRLLSPWSEAFREKHGRTPTLVDVHEAQVPGLLDRFVEYLNALDGLRSDS